MIDDIHVHLDGSDADELRIRHAEGVASACGAHLTGLFTNPLANLAVAMPMDGGAAAAQVMVELDEEIRKSGDRTEQRLKEQFARLSVPNEVRRLEGSSGDILAQAVSAARAADLLVVSRPYGGETSQTGDLFEAVLFQAGRGLYLVPPGRAPADRIRRILVAWRDTRESARALAEAAPLIKAAGRTKVLLVDATRRTSAGEEPGAEVARHIRRSGTEVELAQVASERRAVSEVILDEARRMSADLIVMGAYGHSRAREWILGGTTREMLEASEFPILMAH